MSFEMDIPSKTAHLAVWLNNIYGLPMEAVDRMACMDDETFRYSQPQSYKGRCGFHSIYTQKLLEMCEPGMLSKLLETSPDIKAALEAKLASSQVNAKN